MVRVRLRWVLTSVAGAFTIGHMGARSGLGAAAGRISVDHEDDTGVLRLAGEIDDATIAAYEEGLGASEASGAATVISVVDLAEVTYFSSAGVSFLLRQTRAARDEGRPPALRGLVDPARRILQLTGVTPLFHAAC
jgi:anti-anti-sigma factor